MVPLSCLASSTRRWCFPSFLASYNFTPREARRQRSGQQRRGVVGRRAVDLRPALEVVGDGVVALGGEEVRGAVVGLVGDLARLLRRAPPERVLRAIELAPVAA